jgi:hypothetical protein
VNRKKRQKAVSELIRIAKNDAPIFVSVIGKLAVCMNSIVYLWPQMLEAPMSSKESPLPEITVAAGDLLLLISILLMS